MVTLWGVGTFAQLGGRMVSKIPRVVRIFTTVASPAGWRLGWRCRLVVPVVTKCCLIVTVEVFERLVVVDGGTGCRHRCCGWDGRCRAPGHAFMCEGSGRVAGLGRSAGAGGCGGRDTFAAAIF